MFFVILYPFQIKYNNHVHKSVASFSDETKSRTSGQSYEFGINVDRGDNGLKIYLLSYQLPKAKITLGIEDSFTYIVLEVLLFVLQNSLSSNFTTFVE